MSVHAAERCLGACTILLGRDLREEMLTYGEAMGPSPSWAMCEESQVREELREVIMLPGGVTGWRRRGG